MTTEKSSDRLDKIVSQARAATDEREQGYRSRALKQYPWVCGRCAREFNRDNLQELTVHHRDHNHDNNPLDGSNWELLCVYCHDNEHQRFVFTPGSGGSTIEAASEESTYQPFADLGALLKAKNKS